MRKAIILSAILLSGCATTAEELARRCERATNLTTTAEGALNLAESVALGVCSEDSVSATCQTAINGMTTARTVLETAKATQLIVCSRKI